MVYRPDCYVDLYTDPAETYCQRRHPNELLLFCGNLDAAHANVPVNYDLNINTEI